MPLEQYAPLFDSAASQYGVDPHLLRAIALTESSGNPNAVGPPTKYGQAQGLMQLLPDTAKRLGVKNPVDPAEAIDAGARLIAENTDRYGDSEKAVLAYHGGTDEKNWGPKTQAYRDKVMANYEQLSGGSAQDTIAPDSPFGRLMQKVNSGTPAAAPEVDQNSPFGRLMQKVNTAPAAAPKAASVAAPASEPGTLDKIISADKNLGAGIWHGAQVAPKLLGREGAIFIAKQLGATPEAIERVRAKNALEESLYQEQYGDSSAAGVGNFLGEVVGTAPYLAGLGGAVGAGGKAVAEAAPATEGAVNFLTGASRGNLAQRVASRAGAGYATGATANALIGADPREGGNLGAAINTVVPGLGRVITGARDLARPWTASGRETLANQYINRLAEGGPKAVNDAELVQGSQPTLSQATGNPTLATEERALRRDNPNAFNDRISANNAARLQSLSEVTGTPQTLDTLYAARESQALPLQKQAFEQKQPVKIGWIEGNIDDILKGPAGKTEAVKTNLNKVKANLRNAKGQLETDPEILYGIRKGIASSLTKAAAQSGSDAQLAAKELHEVMDMLDTKIEQGAPGYKEYKKLYADMSKPINEQEYLQNLNITDARGNITLAKVDTAIKNLQKASKLSGVNQAKSISAETVKRLTAIRDDLRREANIDLGKSRGSSTTQELSGVSKKEGMNLLANVGALVNFPSNPLISTGIMATKIAHGMQNKKVQNLILNKMLDAGEGAKALQVGVKQNRLNEYMDRLARHGMAPAAIGIQELQR